MAISTHKFYDSISWFYPVLSAILRPQKLHLIQHLNKLPKGYILDVGVGQGEQLPLYKATEIKGIDSSSKMLKKAENHLPKNGELIKMNAEELQFEDSSFDYVVLSHILSVVKDPKQIVREATRVLKPNGKILILNHFTPNNVLRYADWLFNPISKLLHFKSYFFVGDVVSEKSVSIEQSISLDSLNYYKLLILKKC